MKSTKKNKIRMTITVNEDYSVNTNYSGCTQDMLRCYRALTRFMQASARDMEASAASVISGAIAPACADSDERFKSDKQSSTITQK